MILILHNPLSKNRKSKKEIKKIVKYFKKHAIDYATKNSLNIASLEDYLAKRPHYDRVIIAGGDGTINYLINHSNFENITQQMYIVKNGSGNDFLRTLKLDDSLQTNIHEISFNDEKKLFVNGCGIGLDAAVCCEVNKSVRKNKSTYLKCALKCFFKYKPCECEITVDDKVYNHKKCYFVAIQNGKFFGGGMKIAPKAKSNDHELTVVAISRIPRLLLFVVFGSIYLGLHSKFKKYVSFYTGKKVKVKMENTCHIQTDGEVYENTKEIEVYHHSDVLFKFYKKYTDIN